MRALLRTTACAAVLVPFALLVAGSALAVTITSVQEFGNSTSGAGVNARNVATAMDDPYCPGTTFLINGSGFVYDSGAPDPVKGAVTSVSIGNVPAAWFNVGSDAKLYAQINKGATTGPVVVTTNAGTFSTDSLPGGRVNGNDTSIQGLMPGIQVIPCVSKPTITKATVTGYKPNPVKGGRKVQFNGTGFSGVTSIKIGGKAATFAVVQDQNMVVVVPKGLTGKQAVVIVNPAGTVTATVKLTVKA